MAQYAHLSEHQNIFTIFLNGSIRAEGTMSLHNDTPERLDADFDRYLSDMKPYVLKHPNRTGKMM